ncbi:LysR family transcriptional regulator [Streptomyces sp. NBC_01335]|uniref:LysR family transcriptional regulator n=1 Tax=Streptomyces sp. NBC_01335 TaxID=2903828 RepID=UPI002E0D653E|nr:LysR family transcriptional regulator [Streptomyces sp. NBC_01335]
MNEKSAAEVLAPGLVQLAALARDPNITRAALEAGTSQPTLSRALRRWGSGLGVALVEPDGRGVRLTREGRILALAATDAAALLQRAVERVRDQEAIAALSVGFLRSLGPSVVGELVASFLVDRPDVVVTHHEGAGGDLLEAVESGVVDVAVLTPRPSRRLHWLRLGQQAMTLTVPVGHRLAQGGAVRLAQVRDEPFLALDHRFDTRRVAEELCAAEGFTPRVTLEADSVTTLRDYVAAGLGVAVLPADTSADARTVTLPLATPAASREFGLVWHPGRLRPAAAELVGHARRLGDRYPAWADISG